MKKFKKLTIGFATLLTAPLMAIMPLASADSTVTVTPSNNQGWVFNPDPSTQTPYEFNEDAASIGEGSLYVLPIDSDDADKFIAAKPLGTAAAEVNSLSYDFKIAGDGTDLDAEQFYLNVYTNLPGSAAFYDCRFDFVPATGSTTDFTTATFSSTDTPVNVGDPANDFTCPATWSELPEGSTVSFVAVNVGDTSDSDEGLAGYLDKVVIVTTNETTTYDFEADPTVLNNKDQCKNGGWMTSDSPEYKNQGDCVSAFASTGRARGNPVH